MSLDFTFHLDGNAHAVSIAARSPELVLTVDGARHVVAEAVALAGDQVLLTVDGRSYAVWRTHEGERIHLHIGGRSFSIGYTDAISAARVLAGGDDTLRADMPGVVVAVHATADGSVAPGIASAPGVSKSPSPTRLEVRPPRRRE